MFTTSSKVVWESLQASHLSGKSGRSASTTPLDGLILIAAELLSSDSVFVLFFLGILYIFLSVFFLSYPWTANYPCISNLASLIWHSSMLCTFSQSFFTTWQFSCLSQGYRVGPYQNCIKMPKNLDSLNT